MSGASEPLRHAAFPLAALGIVRLDDEAVDGDRYRSLCAALSSSNPESVRAYRAHQAVLAVAPGHAAEALRISPGMATDVQGAAIVASARIDNLDALPPDEEPAGSPDLVTHRALLAAYRKWGVRFVSHLEGDFGFALWDPSARRLIAARDVLGVRPLFYAQWDRFLLVGADLGAMLAVDPQLARPNVAFLRDAVYGRYDAWNTETAYQRIRRVPPGHYLLAQGGRVQCVRHAHLAERVTDACATDAEYFEQFASLLTRSIAHRVRGGAALWVSGGLDSSSMAGLAHDTLGAAERAQVRLYSACYDYTPEADEREFLDAVSARCPDFGVVRVTCDDCWGLRAIGADGGYRMHEPDVGINRALFVRLLAAVRADGGRVVLTGHWADQILTDGPYQQPELIWDLAPGKWRRGRTRSYGETRYGYPGASGGPLETARVLPRRGGRRAVPETRVARGRRAPSRLSGPASSGHTGCAVGTAPTGSTVEACNPDNYYGQSPKLTIVKKTNGPDNNAAPGVHLVQGEPVCGPTRLRTSAT